MILFRLTLARAAARIVVDQGLAPSFHLSGPHPAGSLSLALSDVRFLRRRGILSCWDGTNEPPLVIATVTPQGSGTSPTPVPGTVTFDLAADPWGRTGTRYDHADQSLWATSVLTTVPVETAQMLGNGYPVIATFVAQTRERPSANRVWGNRAILSIVYQLPATKEGAHYQMASQYQLERAEVDLDTLVGALKQNYTIQVSQESNVDWIEEFQQILVPQLTERQVPIWQQHLDIVVQVSDIE